MRPPSSLTIPLSQLLDDLILCCSINVMAMIFAFMYHC
jgi:hypothetical protein